MNLRNALIALTLPIVFAACGSHSDAMEKAKEIQETVKKNTPGAIATSEDGVYMKATIDGKEWAADEMIPDMDARSSYKRIQGQKGDVQISFSISSSSTTGTKRAFGENNAVDFWTEDGIFGGRTGEVVITRADDKFVEGTFSFTALGDGKSHEVTNGSFRVQATPQEN